MNEQLKFYKGLESDLPMDNIEPGVLYHCIDTGNTYRGTDTNTLELFSSAAGKVAYDDNGNKNIVFDSDISCFQGDVYVNGTDLGNKNTQKVATEQYVKDLLGIEEEFSVSGEVVEFDLDIEEDTELQVISKIHRDETWGLSNRLVLHQVSGSNFVSFSDYLGGVGTTIEKNGLSATINDDNTISIHGTNDSTGYTYLFDRTYWSGDLAERIYPPGTYTRSDDWIIQIRAAQYPSNVAISGIGNLPKTITIPVPFRIVQLRYYVKASATIDATITPGFFYNSSEIDQKYSGTSHIVTFDQAVYEGEFNWATGELKDAEGNTVGYYDVPKIKKLPGTNYFWTGFGENIVSNRKNNEKVILRMNETAPEETIPSICDFMFTPLTPEAAYGLYFAPFLNGGQFNGDEVPILTTKGTLLVKDIDNNIKYSKYIPPTFNTRGVSDILTHKGLEKKWSEKFYLNKLPVSTVTKDPIYTGALTTYVFTWEFDESEFINSGIPAKIHDIAMASPCFINNDQSEGKITGSPEMWNGTPYPAFFSYNEETGKYILTARGIQGGSIKHQLTTWSKVYFYYQLETPYNLPFSFAMGIEPGDQIVFEEDLTDNQPYIDGLGNFQNKNVTPSITAFVPCSVEDAMDGMTNAARILNMEGSEGGDATVQGYSWIGAGDGTTNYTVQIQSKIDELHTSSNGGTIHLGPGTYPIDNSLMIYGNTRIIGDGSTVIEQRADNTHAVIWNGSNIWMRDLTIRLSGECTELTACIYVNSNNTVNTNRNEKYPENMYANYCSISNVTLTGTYGFVWENGYPTLPEEKLAYRGIGLWGAGYFNFFNATDLICKNLYAGIYHGGGSNNYRMQAVDTRFGVHGGGGNNIYEIGGHTLYGYDQNGDRLIATDYPFYGTFAETNMITLSYYDSQYSKGLVYFDGLSQHNHFILPPSGSGISSNYTSSANWGHEYAKIINYGRANIEVTPVDESIVGIGNKLHCISGLPYWNSEFNPSIHNSLSGAGIWGNITTNKNWHENGINLTDICRYPQEIFKQGSISSVIWNDSPSEESPIEIIIDISDRPIISYQSGWIQFDYRYAAESFSIYADTNNDGVFNYPLADISTNNSPIWYRFNYQTTGVPIYRIKITITKALQIPEFHYQSAGYEKFTIDYNPDGLIGIVNIGMPANEAYGRAFLGECGGSLYGNVDMHQNTLKNLPSPVDAGDAVSKAYLEERLSELKLNGGGLSITDDGNGNVSIPSSGDVSITDDGNGNVIIE